MPDEPSDNVQAAINQALPPEYQQAIATNMQVAASSRTPAAPAAPPKPAVVEPLPMPAPVPPTPAITPMPAPTVSPTPASPVLPPVPPVQPQVDRPKPTISRHTPDPIPPVVVQPTPPVTTNVKPAPESKPESLNEFVSQIEGDLIPKTLDLLMGDYAANKEQVHDNLRLAVWRLGELEMVSNPEDLIHREAIGEIAGKLKMLELWAGRLDQGR